MSVCMCVCERESIAWGVQHKQRVGVTWINASFGHEGTARERARLTRTIVGGGLTEKREREREKNNREGATGMERARARGRIQRNRG